MSARPILFSGPMVRAILDGTKTQTRRVIKDPADFGCLTGDCPHTHQAECDARMPSFCPYGVPGDRLWVRETFSRSTIGDAPWYWADGNPTEGDYERPRPSIHMPRWASRLTLEVTEVRVERLQEISEEDARAEGVPFSLMGSTHRVGFENLWNSINAKRGFGWDTNPWVWAITFKAVSPEAL